MEEDKKNIIKLIGLMILYILFSATGVFGQLETALFPIIAVPFAIFCVKHKISVQWQVIFHIAVSISIYLVMNHILSIVIYLMSVVLPVYIILFLYKQKIALPNMMMYGGLVLAVFIFVYFALMKSLGLDFEAYFNTMIDFIDKEFKTVLEGSSNVQVISMVHSNLQTLKMLYPTLVIMQVVLCFSLTLLIVNSYVRRKQEQLPSIKEIFNFRISKVALGLLLISMLLSDLSDKFSPAILVLALNLMNFLMILFEIVGLLSLMSSLVRLSTHLGLKILSSLAIFILFMIAPQLFMFYGCLDSIFNYRNVHIVV